MGHFRKRKPDALPDSAIRLGHYVTQGESPPALLSHFATLNKGRMIRGAWLTLRVQPGPRIIPPFAARLIPRPRPMLRIRLYAPVGALKPKINIDALPRLQKPRIGAFRGATRKI